MPFCAPQIVYTNSWINTTGNIATTTILTPVVNGVYRATYILEDFTGGSNPYNFNSSAPFVSDGTPFTFSVTATNPTDPYSLFIVIEQLQ